MLTCLGLEGCMLELRGSEVERLLRDNTTLKDLNHALEIPGVLGLDQILSARRVNTALTGINLGYGYWGWERDRQRRMTKRGLALCTNHTLRELDITKTKMGAEAVQEIVKGLRETLASRSSASMNATWATLAQGSWRARCMHSRAPASQI